MEYLSMGVGAVCALGGLLLGLAARSRETKRQTADDAGTAAKLATDMEYIKRGIDEIRADLRSQDRRVSDLEIRIARAEDKLEAHCKAEKGA